jgi:hypothetical protein
MAEIVTVPRPASQAGAGFCDTPTAQEIMALLAEQQKQPAEGMTVILGGVGIGKTEAAFEYMRRNRSSAIYYLRAQEKFKDSPRALRNAIATALDVLVGRKWSETDDNIYLRLEDDARRARDRDAGDGPPILWPMIIFDEISYFQISVLAYLRSFWMETNADGRRNGLAIAMIGNEDAYDQFADLFKARKIEAFARRIFQIEHYGQSTADDVECFARHFGVTRPELIAALHDAAERYGLDGVGDAIKLARKLAETEGKTLGVRHIQAAIAKRPHALFAALRR